MKHIPAPGLERVVAQLLVAGGAPDVGGDVVLFRQDILSAQSMTQDRTAAEEMSLMLFGSGAVFEFVEAFEYAGSRAVGHGRHGVVFVVEREVVENVLAVMIHPAHAIL